MSALPHPETPQAYSSPYRLEADEGPQTPAELRAALAVIDPAELSAFNARYDAERFGGKAQARVVTEYRHLVALRSRPEVQAAIAASLAGTSGAVPLESLRSTADVEDGAE